jgi:hypothetical protein
LSPGGEVSKFFPWFKNVLPKRSIKLHKQTTPFSTTALYQLMSVARDLL